MAEVEEELIGDLDYEYDDLDVDEEEEEALLAEDQEATEEILQEDEEEEDLEIIECHGKRDLNEIVIDEVLEQAANEDCDDEESGNDESENESRDRFRNERTTLSLRSERKNEGQIPDSLDHIPLENAIRKGNFNKRGRNMRRGFHSHGGKRFVGIQRPLMNQLIRAPIALLGRHPWQMGQDSTHMQLRSHRPNAMHLQIRGHRPPLRMGFSPIARPIVPNYVLPFASPWVQRQQVPSECNRPLLSQDFDRPQVPPDYEGSYFDFTNDIPMGIPKKHTMQEVAAAVASKGQGLNIHSAMKQVNTENKRGPVKSRLSRPAEKKGSPNNPNLKTVQMVDFQKTKLLDVAEKKDSDDDKYLRELEEQKKKREEFLKIKEKRRQATIAKAVQEVKVAPVEATNLTAVLKTENNLEENEANVGMRSKISLPPQANVKPRIVNISQNIHMRPQVQRSISTRPQSRPFQQRPPSSFDHNKHMNPPLLRMPHPPRSVIPNNPRFKLIPPVRPLIPQQHQLLRPNYYPQSQFTAPQSFNTPPPTFHNTNSPLRPPIPSPNLAMPPPLLPDTSVPPPSSQYQYPTYEQDMSYAQNFEEDSPNDGHYFPEEQYFNQEQALHHFESTYPDQSKESFPVQNYPSRLTPDLRSHLCSKKPQMGQKIQVLSSPSHNSMKPLLQQKKIPATVKKSVVKKYRKITNKKNGEVVSIVLVPLDEKGEVAGDKIIRFKKEGETSAHEMGQTSSRRTTSSNSRVPIVNRMREIVNNSRPLSHAKLVQAETSDFTPISETSVRKNFLLRDLSLQKRKMVSDSDDDHISSRHQIVRIVKRPKNRHAPIRTLISDKDQSECEVHLTNLPLGTLDEDIWNTVSAASVELPMNLDFSTERNRCFLSCFPLDQARQLVNFITQNGINGVNVRATIV